jgi:CheY-like chemotaxis protein
MPELGGIEATEIIRQNKTVQQPEIVGLTANAFSDNINRCLTAGMSKVLTKPIQREQLVNVLAEIANRVSKV